MSPRKPKRAAGASRRKGGAAALLANIESLRAKCLDLAEENEERASDPELTDAAHGEACIAVGIAYRRVAAYLARLARVSRRTDGGRE